MTITLEEYQERIKKKYPAINWNRSSIALTLFDQQITQFWKESDVAVSGDLMVWKHFQHKETYKKVLAGLTLLDTIQSKIGMLELARATKDLQESALYTEFAFYEVIHAKSYSRIFTTLCTNPEIDELFEWVEENKYLQYKANTIAKYYEAIDENDPISLWKAKFASVLLESFLFYSGFFYPLYCAGNGQMKNSAEIINMIIRDEALHGVSVGLYAQEEFKTFSVEVQNELKVWGYELLLDLYDNECAYTEEVYTGTDLASEVKAYVRYNANKAMANIGWDSMFPEEPVNAIVLNGINTQGSTMDFFSQKGLYTIAKMEPITRNTFDFSGDKFKRNNFRK